MKCYTMMTWYDGEHSPPFYVLVEDDHALLHVLDIIANAPGIVEYYEVDLEDGPNFHSALLDKMYPHARSSTPSAKGEGEK